MIDKVRLTNGQKKRRERLGKQRAEAFEAAHPEVLAAERNPRKRKLKRRRRTA